MEEENSCKNCEKDCPFAEDKVNGVCLEWMPIKSET